MGFKPPGLLVVKGEGSTPVIAAPNSPAIDWSLYEAIKVRMISEGGTEIKLKLGSQEMRQKLAPRMEWMVYRFEIPVVPSGFVRPLAIMPTDDLFVAVAFDFIELVPRKETLGAPAGITNIGKLEEYRSTLFARAPASIAFDVPIPAGNTVLHFGLGVAGKAPVTFRILAGPAKAELFSRQVSDPDRWEDAEADLSAYAGTTLRLVLENASNSAGAVGFWSNPLVTSRTLSAPAQCVALRRLHAPSRPHEPVRLRPRHDAVPEAARRFGGGVRRRRGAGFLDQGFGPVHPDVSPGLHARSGE